MSRYINKDILFEEIEELTWYHLNEVLGKMIEGANNKGWYKSEDIFKTIDAIPTADVVKVVRCKDCKYWHDDGIMTTCDKNIGNGYDAEYYCADGERKGQEHETQGCKNR